MVGLRGDEGVAKLARGRQFLPGSDAELAHHVFLAYASDDIRLVARDENAPDPVERSQAKMKAQATGGGNLGNLRGVAHDVENVLDARDGADGHARAVGVPGGNEGRSWPCHGLEQGLDAPRRVDAAFHVHALQIDRRLRRRGGRRGRCVFRPRERGAGECQNQHSESMRGEGGRPEQCGGLRVSGGHGFGNRSGYSKVSSRRKVLVWIGSPCWSE